MSLDYACLNIRGNEMNGNEIAATATIFAGEKGKLLLKFTAIWLVDGVGGIELPGTPSSEIEMRRVMKQGLVHGMQVRHDETAVFDFVIVAPLDWDLDAVTITFFEMIEQLNQLGGSNVNLN